MSKWTEFPIDNLNILPDVDSFEYNIGGLYFKCDFDGQKKTVFFESFLSLRYIDEGDALKVLSEQDFRGSNWLYINEQSDLGSWFDAMSYDAHKDRYKPYLMFTKNDFIEILSINPPIILDS